VQIGLSDQSDVTQITNISTNTITVSPALSGTPTSTAYFVREGDWVWRSDHSVIEVDISGLTPTLALNGSTPRATRVARWPDPHRGKRGSSRSGRWALGDGRPNNMSPAGMYWNEDQDLLHLFDYISYNVTGENDWGWHAAALGAPSVLGGADGTVTVYGQWRTTHEDRLGDTWYGPDRLAWVTKHPGTGLPIGGGVTRSGVHSTIWGPTLWGGEAWPGTSTPGGFAAADLAFNRRYLEYYYPVLGGPIDVEDGFHINQNGSFTDAVTTFQMNKAGYTQIFEPDFDTPRMNVDPAQNSGRPSWTSSDAATGAIWIDGPSKDCVIFSAILTIADEESSASEDAAHVFYRNEHQYSIHTSGFTPGAGGACQNGETYTGLTSLSVLDSSTSYSAALNKVQGGHAAQVVQNWQIGETIRGGTSLCTGTVTVAHRHHECSHGFFRTVTGDFVTNATAAFIIMDPARLETNKTGATVDYTTMAEHIIDVEAEGAVVSESPGSTYQAITGFFCDPNTRYLYTVGTNADTVGGVGFFETVIHVWQLSEAANCVGY
jgi:hypothetical protein